LTLPDGGPPRFRHLAERVHPLRFTNNPDPVNWKKSNPASSLPMAQDWIAALNCNAIFSFWQIKLPFTRVQLPFNMRALIPVPDRALRGTAQIDATAGHNGALGAHLPT
jgi:hypothetical protein